MEVILPIIFHLYDNYYVPKLNQTKQLKVNTIFLVITDQTIMI